jgi:hypothetical protein
MISSHSPKEVPAAVPLKKALIETGAKGQRPIAGAVEMAAAFR